MTRSGIVTSVRTTFAQIDRRNRWPASRFVSTSAMLDRMPLHSSATSTMRPGNSKSSPDRRNATPLSWKRISETSAVPSWSARITASRTTSGSGTISSRNAAGKRPRRSAPTPKQSAIPATPTTTAERITTTSVSFALSAPAKRRLAA
jgi:hypothetical protein